MSVLSKFVVWILALALSLPGVLFYIYWAPVRPTRVCDDVGVNLTESTDPMHSIRTVCVRRRSALHGESGMLSTAPRYADEASV